MVAMISVICIKSGKKKLPPADVIPEVCFPYIYFFIDYLIRRLNCLRIKTILNSTSNSITSQKRVTKIAIDTQIRVNSKIPTVIIPNILARKAPQQEWR